MGFFIYNLAVLSQIVYTFKNLKALSVLYIPDL